MAEFRINISNLSEGIHEYIFETEPSKIGLDKRFVSTVKVKALLDKSLRQILLKADIQVAGIFDCDRCLDSFDQRINVAYSMVYVQDGRSTIDVKKEEEIQVLTSDTNYIDLDADVQQYILLSIPQKLLCNEDCKGLCQSCGVNRNNDSCTCDIEITDSRWDALKKLSHN